MSNDKRYKYIMVKYMIGHSMAGKNSYEMGKWSWCIVKSKRKTKL